MFLLQVIQNHRGTFRTATSFGWNFLATECALLGVWNKLSSESGSIGYYLGLLVKKALNSF
jgi:hypothetical protein